MWNIYHNSTPWCYRDWQRSVWFFVRFNHLLKRARGVLQSCVLCVVLPADRVVDHCAALSAVILYRTSACFHHGTHFGLRTCFKSPEPFHYACCRSVRFFLGCTSSLC